MTIITQILVGIALLFLGHRLFWFFVGAIGFIYGMNLAVQYLGKQPDVVILVIALMVGVVFALLAMFLQRIAVALAGFLAGGYLAMALYHLISQSVTQNNWLFFVIGGVIGVILVAALFDWALILLSSFMGAALITQAFNPAQPLAALLFVALLIIGIGTQSRIITPRRRR